MDDVRVGFSGPPHGTALAAVIGIKLRSFKSSEHNEKGDGSYRGSGYFSLFSDPIDLATWSQKRITVNLHLSTA